jgi:integrase
MKLDNDKRLTDKAVAGLKVPPGKSQILVWDTEVTGFGCVVGKTVTTFVCETRVERIDKGVRKRAKERIKIGIAGRLRDDGHIWNVYLARQRAKELLGRAAGGGTMNPDRARQVGPTLRDAMNVHVARMKKKRRSERSIRDFVTELERHMGAWLDLPITDLTGPALVSIHEAIKASVKRRNGSNPNNPAGAHVANRVVVYVSACWNSLNKQLEGKLGSWNPAKAVDKDTLRPKRVRIEDLADYAARVAKLKSPIRRDGLMLALFTGLRHEDVRTIRFEHVNFEERTVRLPDPKGGEHAAFTIPLSATPLDILRRRERDNVADLERDDLGFAFPGIDNDGTVGPISDLRQQAFVDGKHTRVPAEDVHTLRRTWESIAQEESISELDQHVLSNHSFGSHNVNATYIAQHIDHLRACADKIDAGIKRRMTPQSPKRRHLKAVS